MCTQMHVLSVSLHCNTTFCTRATLGGFSFPSQLFSKKQYEFMVFEVNSPPPLGLAQINQPGSRVPAYEHMVSFPQATLFLQDTALHLTIP